MNYDFPKHILQVSYDGTRKKDYFSFNYGYQFNEAKIVLKLLTYGAKEFTPLFNKKVIKELKNEKVTPSSKPNLQSDIEYKIKVYFKEHKIVTQKPKGTYVSITSCSRPFLCEDDDDD